MVEEVRVLLRVGVADDGPSAREAGHEGAAQKSLAVDGVLEAVGRELPAQVEHVPRESAPFARSHTMAASRYGLPRTNGAASGSTTQPM